MTCANNLHEIGTAVLCYEVSSRAAKDDSSRGTFPPAYSTGEAGGPTNSWRVRMIPWSSWYTFPKDYDYSKPWNGPENSRIYANRDGGGPRIFKCPSSNTGPETTDYVAVVGPKDHVRGTDRARSSVRPMDRTTIRFW